VSADNDRDPARRTIAERGLTPQAVAHFTADALARIDLDKLAPVKGFLKRFFSDQPWTDADDRALADVVGPGEGWWTYELDDDVRLAFGWRDGAFRIDVSRPGDGPVSPRAPHSAPATPVGEEAFASAVTPEATPNPRTIRFVTGPVHTGPSRWYASGDQADDPRVARLFEAFADVANVLVGPDFVAVGLHRADRWEALLVPVLRLVEATFASDRSEGDAADHPTPTSPDGTLDVRGGGAPRATGLDRAWRDLSRLRPDDADELARIVAATSGPDVATRQVAARVLIDADPDVAAGAWRRLLDDPSRTVRRATVDVMVDAEREGLRSLLEHALHDADPWTRWKALHGLVNLGVEPSRAAVAALDTDPDFRVRLEAAGALRRA
jgi:Scaffold protein Nfu/NifU N terminal